MHCCTLNTSVPGPRGKSSGLSRKLRARRSRMQEGAHLGFTCPDLGKGPQPWAGYFHLKASPPLPKLGHHGGSCCRLQDSRQGALQAGPAGPAGGCLGGSAALIATATFSVWKGRPLRPLALSAWGVRRASGDSWKPSEPPSEHGGDAAQEKPRLPALGEGGGPRRCPWHPRPPALSCLPSVTRKTTVPGQVRGRTPPAGRDCVPSGLCRLGLSSCPAQEDQGV